MGWWDWIESWRFAFARLVFTSWDPRALYPTDIHPSLLKEKGCDARHVTLIGLWG